jgi:hypothetical protein
VWLCLKLPNLVRASGSLQYNYLVLSPSLVLFPRICGIGLLSWADPRLELIMPPLIPVLPTFPSTEPAECQLDIRDVGKREIINQRGTGLPYNNKYFLIKNGELLTGHTCGDEPRSKRRSSLLWSLRASKARFLNEMLPIHPDLETKLQFDS